MLLMDKGYFDYDYEKTEKPAEQVDWEDTIKSDEEVDGILAAFGMTANRRKPQTEEEIQDYLLNQMEE